MAKTRVGINGFGRIGRNFFRASLERDTAFELVAFNDLGDVATMAHLLKYDSLLGPLDGDVTVEGGSLKAAGKELKGKLDGVAVRAPIPTGSVTDLTVQLGREVTVDTVNAAYETAAGGPLKEYLQYSTAQLVSTDINQSPYSCIFDSGLTMAGGRIAKVFGWYDNEWGYSCRLVDLTSIVAKSI